MTLYSAWTTGGCRTGCSFAALMYDMAVLRLVSPVGLSAGWRGIVPSDIMSSTQVWSAGYPADKPSATMVSGANLQRAVWGSLLALSLSA